MKRATALSGWGVKGPACFLVEIDGRRLLLDLGEGPDAGRRPDLDGVGPVDAILISHGHPDHVGALDLAERLGNPPVHATAPVRELSGDARLRDARDLPFGGGATIAGLDIETGPAGHAPGAVWTRIGGAAGLLYTGDYSVESPLYPSTPPLPAEALICDASYGDAAEPLDVQAATLVERLRDRALLLPAPPTGRALEMALTFKRAGIEVALCPTTRAVAETLTRHAEAVAQGLAGWPAELLASTATLAADSPARGALIVAGAQVERGLSVALTERFAATGEADIVFTGHVARGSGAEQLLQSGAATLRRWNVHPTLKGLRAIIAAVRPRAMLPAFLPQPRLAPLAAALAANWPDLAIAAQAPAFEW
ncbi:MBL fold metallo-hydrolase [Ancylobacter sp. MQZ15Z-1]|uniref:MBL fold metallo-hydrolase n=1 Tax=Ancylobacter mangrovi TaxID=2972472 RepID=A0A9X2PI12_9HYPH|nr:MBL fold metallo-hydrolase [Ancylobacter mangrovi]MCS0496485.1 MBL fold metallo-hydrolase [Ancylobacter mangrovi]